MKIGVYVSAIAGQKGFENNVSGHAQVPLRSVEELQKAGHEVHFITNEFGEDRSLPFCLNEEMNIHLVTDSRKRGGILERKGKQGTGIRLFGVLKQLREIKKICEEQQLEVLHLFGYNRTAHLAGALRLFGLKIPVVVTVFGVVLPERVSFMKKLLWKRVNRLVTATTYVKGLLEKEGLSAKQIKHGVIRDLLQEQGEGELQPKHRVLFWRDMTHRNGADVALAVFDQLADEYPDISFNFATRPHWAPIEGVEKIANKHSNIQMYHFPYEDGISLPKLLLESLCVVMPIRHMTIDPQLVIAETLASGVPIITTDQQSNSEIVIEGKTGFLVPLGDVEATAAALNTMLSNPEGALEMGRKAKEDISTRWNWDSYASEIADIYREVMM